MELTEQDNIFLDRFRGKTNTTEAQIKMHFQVQNITEMQKIVKLKLQQKNI